MKYNCVGIVKGSKYLGIVEADSEEEAQEKALQLNTVSVRLCHHCTSNVEDPLIEDVLVELVD